MSKNSTPPPKRGQARRIAPARFVEVEHTLAVATQPTAPGLILEAEGLRLVFADRSAVLILADLLSLAQASGKGGRP